MLCRANASNFFHLTKTSDSISNHVQLGMFGAKNTDGGHCESPFKTLKNGSVDVNLVEETFKVFKTLKVWFGRDKVDSVIARNWLIT